MHTTRPLLSLALIALLLAGCAAPTATGTAQPGGKQWDQPPAMSIQPDRAYLATFVTQKGEIRVQLFADKAPVTVNNLVFLAQQGFYDNTTFHRVLADFMAQGGDPTGSGSGGPGYRFADEFHPDLSFDSAGLLAMANSGPDTNGSQFFLTFAPTPWLDGRHTIFGKVVDEASMGVLLSLTPRDPQENPSFSGDVLKTVKIETIASSLLPPPTATAIPVTPVVEAGRPLARLEVPARENLYTGPPALVIDPARTYEATLETTKGAIVVALYPADAPQSVNNFYVLAALGYWDNFPISFVQAGEFLITGSPSGQPQSDVGYTLPPEAKRPQTAGALGYWFRSDRRASSGSQLYLLLADAPGMQGGFSAFGEVTAGLEVARALTAEDRIASVTVVEK